jgi:hypothetical protein
MKIAKANLRKGTYLFVELDDNSKEGGMTYKDEASPKLLKAFQKLNRHLCSLTEQYDNTGQLDYDMVVCRGYSLKGSEEKEGVTLTGLRTIASGRTITLNSPFMIVDIAESDYSEMKQLVEAVTGCRDEIKKFMETHKSTDEEKEEKRIDPQMRIFGAAITDNVILSPEKTATELTEDALNGEEVDVTHLYEQPENVWTEQDETDLKEGVTTDHIQAANAKKNRGKGKK